MTEPADNGLFDYSSKLAEAYCVLHKIPCNRRFTDEELAHPLAQLRYADAMIQRDQIERHVGRADHDQDVFGRPLRAGS